VVRLPPRLRPLFPYLKPAYTLGTRVAAPVSLQLSRARGGWLPAGVATTMEQAAASSGGRCWVARPEEVVARPVPEGRPARHPAFTDNTTEVIPRVAVAELPGGRVIGPHGAVVTPAGELLQELCWYFETTRPREHPIYLHPFPGPPREVPGRLGVLATRGDVNYYHFLMDVLPRLGVLEQSGEVERPSLWYVPARSSFQRQLLDLAGIGPDQRIDSTEVLHVRAECLVVPGLPATDVKNPPWVVAFLRRLLLPPHLERVPGRHIYVTRGDQRNNRIVVNEGQVLEALAPWGFERIDPGALSVAAQIKAFAEADVIVAPHGAALANLVFASPGATLIELFPGGHIVPDYWKMASGVPGFTYQYLAGVGAQGAADRFQLVITDITVDVPALLEMVEAIAGPTSSR
jgi:hypothetical protein